MNRRKFLASSVTASALASETVAKSRGAMAETDRPSPEYYELRIYQLRRGGQHDRMNAFLHGAWLPAMNRIGLSPIGLFEVMVGPQSPSIYALIPYKSLESFATADSRLAADAEFQKSGADVLSVPASAPAHVGIESSFMVAFDGIPKLELPAFGPRQSGRFFELRTYESHSKKSRKKKIEMFNNGEIAIFRRTGLQPVFFGETLIGQNMPNLTYMIAFDSMESHDRNWGTFVQDPEWKKLSSTPGYTDAEIVSNISNMFLRPTSYSQI